MITTSRILATGPSSIRVNSLSRRRSHGVNVTYKLLYNATVAMTGGQDAAGAVGVPNITRILLAHGVKQVLITTEDLDDYKGVDLPDGVEVWDRMRISRGTGATRKGQGRHGAHQ
ncbi:MAG: hypothetical protein R2706_02685 [Acidimicrobiales bacterium]